MDHTEYLHWPWELVATITRRRRRTVSTIEGWIAQRPEGWFTMTDRDEHLQGPYPDEASARAEVKRQLAAQ